MLTLEDLKDRTEKEIKGHLINEYSATEEQMKDLKVLIAYESVGSWGCDSASFFLLKNKKTKQLFEVHGSHCSCYGFENQFEPTETDVTSLKFRVNSAKQIFYGGGYDNDRENNITKVNDYIKKMKNGKKSIIEDK